MNQAPPLEPYNLFEADPVLGSAVATESPADDQAALASFGETVGSVEVFALGHEANRNGPVLHTHDRFGDRVDEIAYHPAYHELMTLSVGEGLHCLHEERPAGEGGHVTRAALSYLMGQVEAGHGCPISMTSSVLPALRHQPDVAAVWEPRILSRSYDPRSLPAGEKLGSLMGMGMTERQGGSDVRANTSAAIPADRGGGGAEYRLTGQKWFTSAPMCDAFLLLAQAPGGLSCFLVPRMLDDHSLNGLQFQRLKDKLGNKSNASGELEFDDVMGWMIGEEGRGVPTIIEMVNGTRLDCVIWAAGLMRQAVSQASWHVTHRSAFGARLIDKPLMRNVIADLELDVEAATLMMVRLSGAHDRAPIDSDEADFSRLATAVAKYWVTKRSTPVVREALECVGGNGYVEESILPRLFRESPLNAIWEGSGNVIALDAVRAITTKPQSAQAFAHELDRALGFDPVLDRAIASAKSLLSGSDFSEVNARRLIEELAVCWAACLLSVRGDASVATAYIRSRIGGDWGTNFGTLPADADLSAIASRAVPAA